VSEIEPSPSRTDVPEQVRVRAAKRERLLAAGVDPYPVELPITTTIAAVRAAHPHLEAGQETDDVVGVAGRVMYLRNTGRLCFATLQDGTGATLQAMLSAGELGTESLTAFKADVDLGDHLFVSGRVVSSKRGELSVLAREWRLAAKALRPLPKSWERDAGDRVTLSEEARVRQRYLDLLMRPEARRMVQIRADVVKSLRANLDERGYIELETPMLQTLHGGAAARPFVTHMNAFDTDLYLRIAPELFLKRAVVGGLERVFEINRNFRNEGLSTRHNPEFTMIEVYQAYADYRTMMDLTEDLICLCADRHAGGSKLTFGDRSLDLTRPWRRATYRELLQEHAGCDMGDAASVRAKARALGIAEAGMDNDVVVNAVFEATVEERLIQPTFVMDYPAALCPLTRRKKDEPGIAERFELYMAGMELANAYTELNDPAVQEENFHIQLRGQQETMATLDTDFVAALKVGMPPAGGLGIGIDRLVMVLTGATTIRDVILFPHMRRRETGEVSKPAGDEETARS